MTEKLEYAILATDDFCKFLVLIKQSRFILVSQSEPGFNRFLHKRSLKMIREQFERLMRMHGHLFPVFLVAGKSFVQFADYNRSRLEAWLDKSVNSTSLLTFFLGDDVEDMQHMLPVPIFVAIAQLNGKQLGLTDKETTDRISRNYRGCEWEFDAQLSFKETMQLPHYDEVREGCLKSLERWAFNEAREFEPAFTELKPFFEEMAKTFPIWSKDTQIKPKCLRGFAG